MFVYNILIMETPIKINIDNNPFFSNEKEIELVNQLLAKKTKKFNERFFKEHCIPNSLLKEKGRLILIPNPNLYNSWLENLKNTPFIFGTGGEVDTCNGKDFDLFFGLNTEPIPPIADNKCFTVYTSIDNAEQLEKEYNDAFLKAFPLTPDECFKKVIKDIKNNTLKLLK